MRTSRRGLVMGVVSLALVASLAPSAFGGPRTSSAIRVGPTGKIIQAGASALIKVGTGCPVGWEVLDTAVTLSQNGKGSDIGAVPMTCDGVRRIYTAQVPASEGSSFSPGVATASVYILLLNLQSGETRTGDALADVNLR